VLVVGPEPPPPHAANPNATVTTPTAANTACEFRRVRLIPIICWPRELAQAPATRLTPRADVDMRASDV
jgi:hypothetical protein